MAVVRQEGSGALYLDSSWAGLLSLPILLCDPPNTPGSLWPFFFFVLAPVGQRCSRETCNH